MRRFSKYCVNTSSSPNPYVLRERLQQGMEEEAARRGLSTVVDCIPALKAYCSEKAKRLFVDNGILSERELEARFEIKNEIYLKKLQIESRVLGDLVLNHIIPTRSLIRTLC